MKYLLLLISFFSVKADAQSPFTFDIRLVDSENKWIVLPIGPDSSYTYGFVYIDSMAGMTFNHEGTFTITSAGTFIPAKMENGVFKKRLQFPNKLMVAEVPPSKYAELKIQAVPDWLAIYQNDPTTVGRQYRWGYLYNAYRECAKGLVYLERAQKINPKYKGLEVEMAFSYNCLGQFDKAIAILQSVILSAPTDAYTHKELIYAQMRKGDLESAAASCRKSIEVCTETRFHGEGCYNLLYNFYKKKDKINFAAWLPAAKKWNEANADLLNSIKLMEAEMNK